MRVRELCGKDFVIGTGPDMSVRNAARRMAEEGVGCLIVVDRQGELAGVVTDRDLVTRALAEGANPDTTAVGDVMTVSPVTIEDDSDLDEAARRMREAGVRRLPIVDRRRRVVGMLSLDDLLGEMGRRMVDLSAVAQNVCRAVRSGGLS